MVTDIGEAAPSCHGATKSRILLTSGRRDRTREGSTMRRALVTPRLSVIIPALNEAAVIGRTLESLNGGNVWEVIVVDGGSSDETALIAQARGALVVGSPSGRGQQMNAGARAARGDILLFLHADTTLPRGFDRSIRCALSEPNTCAAAFRLSIDADGWPFRLIEKLVDFRSRFRTMPYGDQAIAVPATVFHEIGGYPDLPIMEDYVLVRRLRRRGRIAIAPETVSTSARRWLDRGVWRTTLTNQLCIAAYWLGILPSRICRWREVATLRARRDRRH